MPVPRMIVHHFNEAFQYTQEVINKCIIMFRWQNRPNEVKQLAQAPAESDQALKSEPASVVTPSLRRPPCFSQISIPNIRTPPCCGSLMPLSSSTISQSCLWSHLQVLLGSWDGTGLCVETLIHWQQCYLLSSISILLFPSWKPCPVSYRWTKLFKWQVFVSLIY